MKLYFEIMKLELNNSIEFNLKELDDEELDQKKLDHKKLNLKNSIN